jgi:branched-chain amino acid transport system ATP-binding protein
MLRVHGLVSDYGHVRVLRDFSLGLDAGEVIGLLGRNGAGKTTALKTIMGLVRPTRGSIQLDGSELTGIPAHLVPKQGIAYVPQGRRLFGDLTVEENLRVGRMVRDTGQDTVDWVLGLFPILVERMRQRARDLSGGEQQMLAVARALCAEPKVLLMDEPMEGLMPSMIRKMVDTVVALRDRGVAVLLVEQKVDVALTIADHIALLDNGTIKETATPDELHADPAALHRHLGVGAGAYAGRSIATASRSWYIGPLPRDG